MSSSSFLRFAVVGLGNTLVGYAVILFLHYGLGAAPVASNIGGYAVGALLSYGLNRRFTFASQRAHLQALPRFCLVVAACFAINLLVLKICVALFSWPVALAQALAIGAYTLCFYIASRSLVFRT